MVYALLLRVAAGDETSAAAKKLTRLLYEFGMIRVIIAIEAPKWAQS